MATIKLTPSTYQLANTTYLSVTNASNMYTDVDDENYATFYNSRAATTTYYAYIKGFDFSKIPENAIVNSFTIRIRGYEKGINTGTGTTYDVVLVNGTSVFSSGHSGENFTTSAKTITVPTGSMTWDSLKNYGSNLGIRICLRRAAAGTASYIYIYGAEIEVDYTLAEDKKIYLKTNGSWNQYSKVYKKISGLWVEQSELSEVFDTQTNYVKGN